MKNSLIKFPMQLHLLKENFVLFYPLIFFLLSSCTIEQWLAYHWWWYAYQSLRNPTIEHGECTAGAILTQTKPTYAEVAKETICKMYEELLF
jgi:hypothetical protein